MKEIKTSNYKKKFDKKSDWNLPPGVSSNDPNFYSSDSEEEVILVPIDREEFGNDDFHLTLIYQVRDNKVIIDESKAMQLRDSYGNIVDEDFVISPSERDYLQFMAEGDAEDKGLIYQEPEIDEF